MPSREAALVAADHRRREGRVRLTVMPQNVVGSKHKGDSGSAALYGHFGFSPVDINGLLTGE
jgi:hypothetical protein